MAMTEARMGEIAIATLMVKVEHDGGFKVGPNLKRELGNASKEMGIPREELEEFSREILIRFIGKAYGKKNVSLTLSDEPIKTEVIFL